MIRRTFIFLLAFFLLLGVSVTSYAADGTESGQTSSVLIPEISVGFGGTDDPAEVVPALQVLFLVAIIALAPSILILLTGFTRILISLHFLRSAMGTNQMPPNQVLIGVALILTLYMMAPQLTEINENALQPFGNGEISADVALERGMQPIRRFMQAQADPKDISLFIDMSGQTYSTEEEVPDSVLIPAFIIGELTMGFKIGFMIYLPFIVLDMVVASILMAMGMMMLPPAMISMPFKILLFLLAGGWNYTITYIMQTFLGVMKT